MGVSDPERAGRFWAAALGYRRRARRYDGDEWIVLEPPPGTSGTAIAMDLSESAAQEFPRLHIDL
ncbi:glyoxalase, partial [Micromonospora ureilytica]